MTLFKNKYRIESARLKGWDYRNAGYYFVTICTKNREHYFGQITDGEMHRSAVCEIAAQCWREIPDHHVGVDLDEFAIMPNHVHGIVVIRENVETFHGTSLQGKPKMSEISPKAGSLSVIIRSYKSAVTRLAGLNGFKEFAWQPRFYDHIIRDEPSLNKIRQYIFDNPAKWELDKDNPANLHM
jgi:putative transposase